MARVPSPRSIPTCRSSPRRSMPSSTTTAILSPAWETRPTPSLGPSDNGERMPMSPDLTYLLYSLVLCFVQVLLAASGANQQVGLPTLAGNREGLPDIKGWAGRARRAHLNMVENLLLFAPLV